MASKGQILIGMSVDSTKFAGGLKSGSSALGVFGNVLTTTKGNVAAFAAVVGAVGASAFAGMIKGSLDAINSQGDLALQLGVSTSALQQLQFAAEATGSDSATLSAAMEKLQLNMAEAASGSGATSAAFKALGIDFKSLQAQSPDEQFRTIAGALDAVSDSSTQASLTSDIFGKANIGLINTINEGVGALDANKQAALALGTALSDVDNTNIANAQGALDMAGQAISGVVNKLTANLAPAIQVGAELFTELLSEATTSGSIINESFKLAGEATYLLLTGIKNVIDSVKWFYSLLQGPPKGLPATATWATTLSGKLDGVTDSGAKAATAVGSIGKNLNDKVVDGLKSSIDGLFEDLDKKIREFGKTKFAIEQQEIKDSRATARKGITDPNELKKHDAETATKLQQHREKSRIVALNEDPAEQARLAQLKKDKEAKAARDRNRDAFGFDISPVDNTQQVDVTEQLKQGQAGQNDAKAVIAEQQQRDLEAAEAIKESNKKAKDIYRDKLSELERLNTAGADGIKTLNDKDFSKAKKNLQKELREGEKSEREQARANNPEFKGNTLIEAGSVAARQTILANRFGKGPHDFGKEQTELAKQHLAEIKKANKALSSKPVILFKASLN